MTSNFPHKLGAWWYRQGRFGVSHIVLSVIALTMLAPFIWMLLASFKPLREVEALNPLPSVWQGKNYPDVFAQVPFARYYFNSVFIAAWVTFLQVLTSA